MTIIVMHMIGTDHGLYFRTYYALLNISLKIMILAKVGPKLSHVLYYGVCVLNYMYH